MPSKPATPVQVLNLEETLLRIAQFVVKMADKLRNQQELERLQTKYIGTGHPDTTSWEWRTNIQRDTYSSIVGHRPLLSYIALAENEPLPKIRAQMIRKMIQPCGPPPPREG